MALGRCSHDVLLLSFVNLMANAQAAILRYVVAWSLPSPGWPSWCILVALVVVVVLMVVPVVVLVAVAVAYAGLGVLVLIVLNVS